MPRDETSHILFYRCVLCICCSSHVMRWMTLIAPRHALCCSDVPKTICCCCHMQAPRTAIAGVLERLSLVLACGRLADVICWLAFMLDEWHIYLPHPYPPPQPQPQPQPPALAPPNQAQRKDMNSNASAIDTG